MKSDRRHELETNVLANRLGAVIETGRPVGGLVLIGIVLIIVAALGYGAFTSWTHKANSEAWTEFYLLDDGNAEAFNTVVESFPSSSAAPWARQAMGDSQLARGIDLLYTNRATGETMIGDAVTSYKAVLDSTYDNELRYKAMLGLAQAYESLGKLDDAIKQFEQVEKSPAPAAITKLARERIEWLRNDASKNFYRWFASLKPAPDAPPPLPNNLSVPPTAPDISFPTKDALNLTTPTTAADSRAEASTSGTAIQIKSDPPTTNSQSGAAAPVETKIDSSNNTSAPNANTPAANLAPAGSAPPAPSGPVVPAPSPATNENASQPPSPVK